MNGTDLSIIVVNYNTKDFLRACLESVYKNSYGLVLEVFVIDNCSNDGSSYMIRELFPWVKLICNTENRGFAAANNQGLKKCRGRYVMLLNSDTVVLGESLLRIIRFMDRHLEAGAVGCRLINSDGTLQPSITSFPSPFKDFAGIVLKGTVLQNTPSTRARLSRFASFLRMNMSRFDDHSQTKEIDYPRGACFTVRRETVQQVGLLDEGYFFTGEEMDWCYRMKHLGWRVYYYPDAAVIHHDHGASRDFMGKVFIQTRKSALRFYEKHYGKTKTEIMKALVATVLILKCIAVIIGLFFRAPNRATLLAKLESYCATARIHYDRKFRALNVFSEMPFRYL